MKTRYTLCIGLSLAMLATQAFGQVQKAKKAGSPSAEPSLQDPTDTHIKTKPLRSLPKGGDTPTVYWSEDFSNGLAGQGDNGPWTTGQNNGNLWFQTFPIGAENGYDPLSPLDNPVYNNTIPNFYLNTDGTISNILDSPTSDNGVMMLDADRYNSNATEPDDVGSEHSLTNTILSTLTSPSFDLSTAGPNLVLTFSELLRKCCNGGQATVELSTDGGSTWVPFDVFNPYGGINNRITENVSINISETIATATTDLTDCKVRFFWAGSTTLYYWFIDDVAISDLADNDLSIGKTYYNDFDRINSGLNAGTVTSEEYYEAFEYNQQPDYLTRPFSFGAIISNIGATTQTGVTLHVDATLPDGSVVMDYAVSEPIIMEVGAVDTVFIADIMPDVSVTGTYTFEYTITQNEIDQVPGNNAGTTQSATLNREIDNNGYAIASNDARITGNYAYTESGQDQIWGVPYVFPEATDGQAKWITHVEAVLLYNEGFVETLPGELIYFNVRKGWLYDEDDNDPTTATTVFFDSGNTLDYDAIELEHEIQESEIWNSDSGDAPIWLSFELPTPILIEANTIYQAEFRVPAAGDNVVFPTLASNQEQYACFNYDVSAAVWYYLTGSAADTYSSLAIRFRTSADPTSVEKISQENGMELVQNYPNPFTTSTKIQYRIEETSQASLEVRDLTGKLVFNKDLGMTVGGTANTYELHRGSLAPGLYTYSIVTSENTITRKLTVQ